MDTVVVSQLGARMHYAVPRMLHEAGRLEWLYTDICAVKGWPRAVAAVPDRLLPSSLRRLTGRIPNGVPREKIMCFSAVGLSANLRRTIKPTPAQDTKVALAAGRTFSRYVVQRGFGSAGGFYGISGECLEQLQAARQQGLWTAVEQIIAPRAVVDRLIGSEAVRHPEWQAADEADPLAGAYAAREKAEWEASDIVICPSEFVRQGVEEVGGPVERCVVVPYGIDTRFQRPSRPRRRSGPLRVLTVGAMGLRKGSPYVLEAARRFGKNARFRMVGPAVLPEALRQKFNGSLELVGSTPRSEMIRHYEWADVFLLPSICEGSATVTYEALSAGLPVITTPNAGSVVRDCVDGFICPPGDVDAICARLEQLARDGDMLDQMASEARTGATDHDLAAYGRRLIAALDRLSTAAGAATAVGP